MSAGLNGWGEGGTFDCQEEGVDGQAPAGPACHGMATWIKCWRMSWTPFSCGGRKYELETAWLWYFRATLIFHHEGAAIDVEMYLLRSILIHLGHVSWWWKRSACPEWLDDRCSWHLSHAKPEHTPADDLSCWGTHWDLYHNTLHKTPGTVRWFNRFCSDKIIAGRDSRASFLEQI